MGSGLETVFRIGVKNQVGAKDVWRIWEYLKEFLVSAAPPRFSKPQTCMIIDSPTGSTRSSTGS